jgi:hypothetical protein
MQARHVVVLVGSLVFSAAVAASCDFPYDSLKLALGSGGAVSGGAGSSSSSSGSDGTSGSSGVVSGGSGGAGSSGSSSGSGGAASSGSSSSSSGGGGCGPCDHDCDQWPSWECDGGDCNDEDPRVNPGTTTYYTTPMHAGARPGTEPFDYDCNGVEDHDPTQILTQCGYDGLSAEADCSRSCSQGSGDGRSPGPGFQPGAGGACGLPADVGVCSSDVFGFCSSGWDSCSGAEAQTACK